MSKQVKINGSQVPFRVSFRAIKNFQLKTGKGFESLDNPTMEDMLILFTECFKSGQRKETGKEPTITPEQVEDWFDQSDGFEIIRQCQEELADQMQKLFPAEAVEEEKKPTGGGQ